MRVTAAGALVLLLVACSPTAEVRPHFVSYITPTPTPESTPEIAPVASPEPISEPAPVETPVPTPMGVTAQALSPSRSLRVDSLSAVYAEAEVPLEWQADLGAIAECESHGDASKSGDSGESLGLHQLWRGWFREGEDPFDAVTNSRVAVRVRTIRGRYGGAGGWTCADILGIP